MRRILLLACLVGALGAQAQHRIIAVERKGQPPFEAADRIYRLEGGRDRGLRVGHRLVLRRPGEPKPLGHLRVIEVREAEAEARFESAGTIYPLKGDLAWREELAALPAVPALSADPMPPPPRPAQPPGPPPREGLLFFQPQGFELSPAGQQKLQAWVKAWGVPGRWIVQIPASKTLRPALQKQRADAMLVALRALGIEHATVEKDLRVAEGKYDPVWIRHWD